MAGGREIRVDREELESLAGRLELVTGDLKDRVQFLAVDANELDSAKLAGVLEDFLTNWSDGVARLEREVKDAADHLRAAAKAYEESDTAIAHAAHQPAAGGTPE